MLEEIYWEPEIYEVYGNLFPVRTLYETLQISVLLLFLSFNVDRIALSLVEKAKKQHFLVLQVIPLMCIIKYVADVVRTLVKSRHLREAKRGRDVGHVTQLWWMDVVCLSPNPGNTKKQWH